MKCGQCVDQLMEICQMPFELTDKQLTLGRNLPLYNWGQTKLVFCADKLILAKSYIIQIFPLTIQWDKLKQLLRIFFLSLFMQFLKWGLQDLSLISCFLIQCYLAYRGVKFDTFFFLNHIWFKNIDCKTVKRTLWVTFWVCHNSLFSVMIQVIPIVEPSSLSTLVNMHNSLLITVVQFGLLLFKALYYVGEMILFPFKLLAKLLLTLGSLFSHVLMQCWLLLVGKSC